MPTRTCDVHEAQTHLPRLLQEVASGTKVIIVSKTGKPTALLTRIEEEKPGILFGVLKDKVKVAEDFDAPLPEDVLAEFEGSGCVC